MRRRFDDERALGPMAQTVETPIAAELGRDYGQRQS
jgi:hypothetical protein